MSDFDDIATCVAKLAVDHGRLDPQMATDLLALVRGVVDANRTLWNLEDDVRREADDTAVGALKRRIDTANLARHKRIDELDVVIGIAATAATRTSTKTTGATRASTKRKPGGRTADANNPERNGRTGNDVEPATGANVRNSESIGELVDRLSILALKRGVLAPGPRLDAVHARWAHAFATLDHCIAAALGGQLVLVPRAEVKLYGEGHARD